MLPDPALGSHFVRGLISMLLLGAALVGVGALVIGATPAGTAVQALAYSNAQPTSLDVPATAPEGFGLPESSGFSQEEGLTAKAIRGYDLAPNLERPPRAEATAPFFGDAFNYVNLAGDSSRVRSASLRLDARFVAPRVTSWLDEAATAKVPDGRPIVGSIKDNYDTAHIPLDEWLTWSSLNSP